MINNTTINKFLASSILIILISFSVLFTYINHVQAEYDLKSSPNNDMYLEVVNPGNLPFVHDKELSNLDLNSNHYGTIHNETGYKAFAKALDFSIKTLIKLVGVMSLFGLTEGFIRLIVGHGNEEVYSAGVKMIMWSIVGLILSLIAHAVVTGALQFLTGVGSLNL